MSSKKAPIQIGVIDYGMGNLHSVAKALVAQSARVTVTDQQSKLKGSDLLVLPGVGSFGAAMKTLRKKRLDDLVRAWVADGKPYLGICLGFQLLFESSEEDRGVKGLGILKGRVQRFRRTDFRGNFQIPHMGWNEAGSRDKRSRYLKGIASSDLFYFVHSFYPVPKDRDVVLTETPYGKKFCSSVATENLFACQFHPEKSGAVGLQLLSNVVASVRAA